MKGTDKVEQASELLTKFNECAAASGISKAFCEGGSVMWLILAVGLLAVFLIVERFYTLQKMSIDKKVIIENLYGLIFRGDIKQAIAYCDSNKTPLTNTLKAGLHQVLNKRPDEEVQVAMDATVIEETPRIEGWTSFLAVFGNVAVLIGLMGTIFGLIIAFGGVADADPATKAAILSMGISHALNCTAFGLFVAILSIVMFGFFQMRIGKITNDLLESSMKVMNMVCANRDKVKY